MAQSDQHETVPERPPTTGGPTPARPPEPPVPSRLGPYQLLEKIGSGGMGRVYKALHSHLKRVVALKVLPEERMHDAQAVARFQQEMEAVGRLDHRHIIRATDAGEAGGCHFLVMEFADGFDLSRLVRGCGPLPIDDACELIGQAAAGLQYIHEHGLVHRDLKPSNLLLTRAGEVKILDLGLARLHRPETANARLTASGEAMGTADYMAPEQAFDAQKVDIRADIYSLGCTLYKLLTGQAPFGGPDHDSRFKKMMAHAQQAVPPVRDRRPEVPAGLAAVLDRLLAKAPEDRCATPAEVAAALAPFREGCDLARLLARAEANAGADREPAAETHSNRPATPPPVPAQPGASSTRTRVPVWRRPAAAGVALLLLAGLGLALAGLLRRTPRVEVPGTAPAGGPPAATTPAAVPARARELKPGSWVHLLDQPPTEVVWTNASGESRWDYNRDRQELRVDCVGTSLLGLGSAPRPGYRLEVVIRQARWTAGVGVFLGYQPFEDKTGPGWKCQVLELREFRQGGDQPFALHRSTAVIRRAANGSSLISTTGVASTPLRRPPDRHEVLLELTVRRPQGLAGVRWDGVDLPALTSAPANDRFHDADFVGGFGAFNYTNSCVYQDARVMLFGRDGP
jgi:serine/threonine protein kinase